jgi:hypothetical protein
MTINPTANTVRRCAGISGRIVVVQRYGGLCWTAGPSRRDSGAGW